VDILVQPDGDTKVNATFDVTYGKTCFVAAAAFPQSSVPHLALYRAARHLGSKLYERGIRGHVSLDFVAYALETSKVSLWARNISVSYSHTASSFESFRCLTGGRFDAIGGKYVVPNKNKWSRRTFVTVPELSHACLSLVKIKELFRLCQMHGVAFDPTGRVGTALLFPAPLATGQIGVICVETKRKGSLRKMCTLFDFLKDHVGSGFPRADFSKPNTYTEAKIAVKSMLGI